jgi:hypothetical protein
MHVAIHQKVCKLFRNVSKYELIQIDGPEVKPSIAKSSESPS